MDAKLLAISNQLSNPLSMKKVMIASGAAKILVDITLFPFDTIKTRLQAECGFKRSGGFGCIYKGLAPSLFGGVPATAIFFSSYEGCKQYFTEATGYVNSPYIHMLSACIAKVNCCFVRVPFEVAKQRQQASIKKQGVIEILWNAYKNEGIRRGIYRGYCSTITREIAYSMFQFPLLEYFTLHWTNVTGIETSPLSAAICGAITGGISAAVTTPLDVLKTRCMLAKQGGSFKNDLVTVYRESGIKGMFAGIIPRVLWVSLGAFCFFGFFDLSLRLLNKLEDYNNSDSDER